MPSNAGPSRTDVVDSIRACLPRVLVATDFDGTLAPLVADPERSEPADGAVEALGVLGRAGARIAVITGRDAATVVRLGRFADVPGLQVAGLYGAESWHDGRLDTRDVPPSLDTVRERLPETLAGAGADPAVWIEDKRLSLVVHTRTAADPRAEFAALTGPVRALADELHLEVHPGSNVLEIRLPGYDKAGALAGLLDAHHPRAALYLGDDLGDLPAFGEIVRRREAGLAAYGVGVLSSAAPGLADAADVTVPDPAAATAFLQALTAD